MEPLKEQFFNQSFYRVLEEELIKVNSNHSAKEFKEAIEGYEELELMDRLKQVGDALDKTIKGTFLQKLEVVKKLAPQIRSFPGMALPYFVEKYGLAYFDESMEALKFLTSFSSSEFAVRVFIKQDVEKALALMSKWASDSNNHIRRLASEGARPLLPWSFKLDSIIENPDLTRPILDTLKQDNDLYVKKSVGNHLNDHSKNHAKWVVDYVGTWDLDNPNSSWMAKKGVRTLIKEGFPESYSIMGFEKQPQYSLGETKLINNTISLGEALEFKFNIASNKNSGQLLNVDFVIYYLKKNGKLAPKVFKLKELLLKSGEGVELSKKHKFEDFSTRKHYLGIHQVAIKVNGVEGKRVSFNLV